MPPTPVHAQVHFRPMTLKDIEQAQDIDNQSFPKPWPKDAFHYELTRNRNAVCWVAEILTEEKSLYLIGTTVIWLVAGEAHIGTLAVRPAFRDKKIGQQLLARALLACVQQGAQTAMLEVRQSNLVAQNLYKKFGFEAVGRRKAYYKDNREDAILMTLKKLAPDRLATLAEPG